MGVLRVSATAARIVHITAIACNSLLGKGGAGGEASTWFQATLSVGGVPRAQVTSMVSMFTKPSTVLASLILGGCLLHYTSRCKVAR